MYLVRTINGTIRLMSDDEMNMSDIDKCICDTYRYLNKSQRDDLYEGYKTCITDAQVKQIEGMF